MDSRFTPEEEALRNEFDAFSRKEMKNALSEWESATKTIFNTEECWEFHKQMTTKLADRDEIATKQQGEHYDNW